MKRRGSGWRLTILAAFALMAVAAIGASGGLSARTQGGTIINGTTDTVTSIDPAGTYDFGTFTLDINVFEHLLDYKNGTKLEPSLATRCFSVGTLATWRCNLRRGVTFHDGSAFDSADVKFSIDRVANKAIVKQAGANSPSPLLGNLKSVQTNGKYAVTFNLKSPQVTWPANLSSQCCFIVPSDTYAPNSLRPNSDSQIGTGPYKLARYTPGQQAVLERYDDYWGPKAKNDGLIIRYYSKSSTMKLALERGEIDMAFQTFTPTELASLAEASGLQVHTGPGGIIRYLVFNVAREPTSNIAVRKAVAYLMPRQTIARRVYRNTVQPLYSMTPAGYPSHVDSFAALYGRAPSPAKAKQVLQRAGLETPLPIEIWWTPTHYGDASAEEYAEIKRGLERNGVFKVTLRSTEWAQYSDVFGRQYDAFQLGWFPDYPDAENYAVPFYRSDSFTQSEYNNPRMEALLKAELGAKSNSARDAILRQIQRLGARDVPMIPVWQARMVAAARNNVRGVPATLDPTVIMRFWKLSKS